MLTIQKKITNEIIEALKSGVKPWTCPWDAGINYGLPINFTTEARYSGINAVILWYRTFKYGYTSNAWLTFAQAKRLNGHIIKGAKGTVCVFYSLKEVEDKETGEKKDVPIIKPFIVFNMDQIDGIKRDKPIIPLREFNPVKKGEQILEASKAKILSGGGRAFYNRNLDQIVLPERGAFRTREDFYATALHELVHWTGHKARLGRKQGMSFGDSDYAFEELVAELGSAFLSAEIGLKGELQHASYIDHWLKILQQDARAIFRAASLAAKAHKFITAFVEPTSETEKVA